MKTIVMKAVMENMDEMIDFIIECISDIKGDDNKFNNKMRLVSEEALVNIINYAYPEGNGDIEIKYEGNEDNQGFKLSIIDSGIAFDPLKKEDPDLTLAMEDRQIGGLGIYMIKQIMDNVSYKREAGKNILILEKKFL